MYGIEVTAPKFGVSKDKFEFDKDKKIIKKGLSSIKYFNSKVSEELYELSKSREFDRFSDVLYALKDSSINSKQLDILIKIDFFSDFGNVVELSRINAMFEQMKKGDAKKIKREGLGGIVEEIVSKHATCISKDGKELKSYAVTDMVGLIRNMEDYIMSMGISDLSLKTKIANQKELLGTISVATHNQGDRRKLYVENVKSLSKNKNVWGFSVDTVSIGTGKKSNFTLYSDKYKLSPVYKSDIIYCDNCYKNNKGYWILSEYHRI